MKNQTGALKSAVILVSLAALSCGVFSKSPPSHLDSVVVLTKSGGESLTVHAEIVDTPVARSRGLMYRRELPEGTGMLFLFPRESRTAFWMKNTLISLDLIFVKDDRIVSLIQNAEPLNEKLLQPDAGYTMTLEVPGGYAARHGLKVGDRFEWKRSR